MLVTGAHAVEEKGVHVVVEHLMVKEEFAEEAEIAAPRTLAAAIDLEHADVVVPVDFVAGRVQQGTFEPVPFKGPLVVKVAEAELAHVDDIGLGKGDRVRREIPRLHLVRAHGDSSQVAHARDFRLVLRHAAARP